MYPNRKTNPEVQPHPERRRFSTDYKRRIVIEADQCRHGEMRALLRREGLTYTQVASWRKAHHDGTLVNKPPGTFPNPNRSFSMMYPAAASRSYTIPSGIALTRRDHRRIARSRRGEMTVMGKLKRIQTIIRVHFVLKPQSKIVWVLNHPSIMSDWGK